MKETTNDNDKFLIWRHTRHCVILLNVILSLATIHYMAYLLYGLWKFIF